MSCCGNKRNEYARKQLAENVSDRPFYAPVTPARSQEDSLFEYTGETGLTVTGTISGNQYRFQGNGDTQWIDYRDAGGMMAVPVLRKLKTTSDGITSI